MMDFNTDTFCKSEFGEKYLKVVKTMMNFDLHSIYESGFGEEYERQMEAEEENGLDYDDYV